MARVQLHVHDHDAPRRGDDSAGGVPSAPTAPAASSSAAAASDETLPFVEGALVMLTSLVKVTKENEVHAALFLRDLMFTGAGLGLQAAHSTDVAHTP